MPQLAAEPGEPPAASVAKAVAAKVAKTESPKAATTTPTLPAAPPNLRGALPVGKGMWIWMPDKAEGGNPHAIVAKAKDVGLTHLYVRTGSSKVGFNAAPFLDQILPVAHAAGIRVYGWDFPYLDNVGMDVARAAQAARYTTPTGHRIDGFAADIEFKSMGVNLSPESTSLYGRALREGVGPNFPLIAVVPRPSLTVKFYPYEQVAQSFDAIAPMVYWMQTDPHVANQQAWARLAHLGKPIMPIGQAYDGFPEGGPPGVPGRDAIHKFMGSASAHGASGVSFWSWQHATPEVWQAVKDAAVFQLPAAPIDGFREDQLRLYQVLLSSLGFGVPATGKWGPEGEAAVRAFQTAARLPVTGMIDVATREMLLRPVNPPLRMS